MSLQGGVLEPGFQIPYKHKVLMEYYLKQVAQVPQASKSLSSLSPAPSPPFHPVLVALAKCLGNALEAALMSS